MKLFLVTFIVVFSFQSFVFANENMCEVVEKQCAEGAGEDDSGLYGECLAEAAPEINAFLYDWGLVCEGEANYCSVAKEQCAEYVSGGYYESLNECLSVRASNSCI